MNFAFLSKCDDLVSGALVDSFYLWFSTLKMTKEYACPRVDTDKVHDIVKRQVVQAGKLGPAAMELLELSPFREFYESASVKEKQVFVQHLKRYLNMYHPKAGYEIAETKRYSSNGRKGEACLCATKEWHVGDEIRYCGGVTVTLTPEEDAQLRAKQQDFSVMYSVKKGTSCLFLGPARFVNHDCDANCNFIAAGLNSVTFKVIKDIQIGEEITVFYGEHYFGVKNCECLCATCEKRGEGAFKKPGSAEEDAEEEDWRTTGGVRRSSRKRKVIESNDFVDPDVENHDPARSSTISREDDVERIEDIGKLQQGVLQCGSRQNNNLLLQGRRVMADNGQTPRGRKRRSDETESIESPQRDMKRQNIQDTNTPETWQRSSSFLPIRDDQHVYTGNSYQYSQCQYLAYQYPRYPYSAYQQSLYPYFGSVWLNVGIYPHTAMGTDYRTSSHIAPTGPMSQYHDQHATMTTMYADIHGQNNAAQAEYPQVHPRYERMQFPAPNNFCGTSFIPSNDRTSTFIPSPALVDYQAQTFVPSNHTTPTSISPPIFEGSQAQSSIFSNHPTATFIPSPIYEGSQAQTFVPSDHPTPTSIPLPIYQGSQAQTSVARNHPMPISRPPPVYEDSPAQLFESSNHSMPTFIPSPTYEGSQAQPFVQTTAATISSESQESNTESNVMSIDFICSEATQDKWYEELFEGSDLSSLASEEFKCMTCDQGIEGDDIWYCTRCSRHWKIYGLEWPVRKLIGKRGRKSNEKKSYSA